MENSSHGNIVSKRTRVACEECRKNKRKCDGGQPTCGLCQKGRRICEYASDIPNRKRKRWDDEYVRSLEEQIKTLTALVKASNMHDFNTTEPAGCFTETFQTNASSKTSTTTLSGTMSDSKDALQYGTNINAPSTVEKESSSRSVEVRSTSALEDLGSLMLKLNLEDEGEPCFAIATINSDFGRPENLDRYMPGNISSSRTALPSEFQDSSLKRELLECFCMHFNNHHHIMDSEDIARTRYEALSDHPLDLRFRNMTAIAIGARYSNLENSIELSLAASAYSKSILLECLRDWATPFTVQGLTMLAWLELQLGHDMASWNFNSSATGLSLRLGIHVTALSQRPPLDDGKAFRIYRLKVRTFWSYFSVDRMITAVLGMNCTMPWQRVRVPPFTSIISNSSPTIEEIAFCRQGQLWHLWDSFMDQIYAFDWETLTGTGKMSLLSRSHQALISFYQESDSALRQRSGNAPDGVITFQLAFYTAVLLVYRPFLGDAPGSQTLQLALKVATDSATAVCRIVREVRKTRSLRDFPSQIMNYIICAATIHLLNATSGRTSLGRRSSGHLKLCFEVLDEIGACWHSRKATSIRFLQDLAHKWKVVWALPLKFSAPLTSQISTHPEKGAPSTRNPTSEGIDIQEDSESLGSQLFGLESSYFTLDQFSPFTDEVFE